MLTTKVGVVVLGREGGEGGGLVSTLLKASAWGSAQKWARLFETWHPPIGSWEKESGQVNSAQAKWKCKVEKKYIKKELRPIRARAVGAHTNFA